MTVNRLYEIAITSNIDLILDTNIRLKPWKQAERARNTLSKFLKVKMILTNMENLSILVLGLNTIDAAKKILNKGAEIVIVKLGNEGAFAVDREGKAYRSSAFIVPFVEDVIGADDAFNVALLASIYHSLFVDEVLTCVSSWSISSNCKRRYRSLTIM